jgi:hypothetical protein
MLVLHSVTLTAHVGISTVARIHIFLIATSEIAGVD